MKYFFWIGVFSFQFIYAQKLKKADKQILANLETHIKYLADDKLEGRRTGTAGEKLAYEYIIAQFQKAGLEPKGEKGSWMQEFEVNEGKQVDAASHLIIDGNDLKLNKEYFPFSWSPNGSLESTASLALQETASPWFLDLKELLEANRNNPHFDPAAEIRTRSGSAARKGATALTVFNTSAVNDELKFEAREAGELAAIPVLYVSKEAKQKYMGDETGTLDIKLRVAISTKTRSGHNVIGYINNNKASTIIIGAHYDHLGYGEDHNSLSLSATPQIHNGADDNASGTAALMELARMLKAAKLPGYNYLFIAFSGEELGLFGSKYFTEHPSVALSDVNYMVNIDMIGRLKDSSHLLNIGGYGTAAEWGGIFEKKDKYLNINFDSSGTGPSDHTSFYRKDIPVLFFFTGPHSDYHKPADDAEKINYTGELQVLKFIYAVIEKTNKMAKIAFTRTRETQINTSSSFRVTLGIMPDYTFSGGGVRADGVIEGRPAHRAGLKAGDVITQLGDYKFTDLEGYMQTLNKFNKGDSTRVKVKRGTEEHTFDIVF